MSDRKGVSLKDVTKRAFESLGKIPDFGSISWKDQCPHCGYYCTGKTAFCTKHPQSKGGNDSE